MNSIQTLLEEPALKLGMEAVVGALGKKIAGSSWVEELAQTMGTLASQYLVDALAAHRWIKDRVIFEVEPSLPDLMASVAMAVSTHKAWMTTMAAKGAPSKPAQRFLNAAGRPRAVPVRDDKAAVLACMDIDAESRKRNFFASKQVEQTKRMRIHTKSTDNVGTFEPATGIFDMYVYIYIHHHIQLHMCRNSSPDSTRISCDAIWRGIALYNAGPPATVETKIMSDQRTQGNLRDPQILENPLVSYEIPSDPCEE